MKLKNLMENKQLDFNQPFLSVRRFSSTETLSKANDIPRMDNRWPPLPVYKSELKSGPVRNPGNVPFLWEHAPGRPKDGRKSQTIASKPPSDAPNRLPGMSSDSEQQHCGKGSKSGTATQSPTGGGDAFPNPDHSPSHKNKNIVKFRTLKERIERDLSSGSEDGHEAYLEANDALSRSESFSMSCSVTGMSGLDGGDVKASGAFEKDQQTCEFMMERFLPAAKALASETPQVTYKKQSVQKEQQREARKIVEMDKEHRATSLPTKFPYYAPPNPHDEVISEDEDNNLDESEYSSAKACGLFARFCLRGSLCLLQPVPGMRMRGSNVASAHGVQNGNLSDSSCSSIKNLGIEEKSLDGNQMVELHEENSVLKGRSNDPKKLKKSLLSEGKVFPTGPERVKSSKVHNEPHRRGRSKFRELLANESCLESPDVVEKTLYVDSVHDMKYQSSNSSPADKMGVRDCLMADSDKSTSSETKETLHLDSSSQHVQPSNAEGETKRRLSSKSLESMDSCSSYYDAKANSKSSEEDFIQDGMVLPKAKAVDESKVDSGSERSERPGNQESLRSLHHKKSSQEESSDNSFEDFASFTSSEASSNNREKFHSVSKVPKGSDVEENYNGHDQSSITLTSSRTTARGKIDLERACGLKSSLPISSQLALAPPLPKSPSESWLKRTLPTISSRNSVPQSTLAARVYATRQNTVF